MTIPRATYRLQFRCGMDFAKAAGLVPYFERLGVSHVYASPLFQATPGSTHGYDVTDFGKFDDCLGGKDTFDLFSAALREQGLGLILDIVPNHMAASCHNPWWRDVLRHGPSSAYAGHFDIDWTQPKLLLPILDRPYGSALEAGAFRLGHEQDGLIWEAAGQKLPLDPASWPLVLDGFGVIDMRSLAADPDGFPSWQEEVDNAARLAAHLSMVSRDANRMHAIHEAQSWRLAFWRAARDSLTYRRFFEISDLVGVRVEEPNVFDDVHRFTFELIADGYVDGLRIDHVDGLSDPKDYLDRLNEALPRPVPIWVEKILERDERLRDDWRVAGATGYEFMATTSAVLTNGTAASELDRAYSAFCGQAFDYDKMRAAAKREVLSRNLAAELGTLVDLARQAFAGDLSNRDWGPDALRRAISALLVAMPVYRTYLGSDKASPNDGEVIAGAADDARQDEELDDPSIVGAVASRLVAANDDASLRFRNRFQQVSGALMAKAVEDTLFYRFNRLISANEVGSDPSVLAMRPEEYHAFAKDRAAHTPLALNATATHDTKRGADARMRIAAISEAPEGWAEAVSQFEAVLARDGKIAEIDANTRWLFYQALLGSWHTDLQDDLVKRVEAFVLKASRESKSYTSWVKTDTEYEQRLQRFVKQTLSSADFLEAFEKRASDYIAIGERKSLIQLTLKLTLPGIPDIYQGTEIGDFSFVDPDNRRPVDFDRLRQLLENVDRGQKHDFDMRKFALLNFGLRLRRAHPDVFVGGYHPLRVDAKPGGRTLAFARNGRTETLVVAADLCGGSASAEKLSLQLPHTIRLKDTVTTYPATAAFDFTSHDVVLAVNLGAFGVSLGLFSVESGHG